jgi:hypothetical protein
MEYIITHSIGNDDIVTRRRRSHAVAAASLERAVYDALSTDGGLDTERGRRAMAHARAISDAICNGEYRTPEPGHYQEEVVFIHHTLRNRVTLRMERGV